MGGRAQREVLAQMALPDLELPQPFELIEATRYRTALAGGTRELCWTSPCELSSKVFREEFGNRD